MKKIVLTFVALFTALSLLAVPARPGKFWYTQPDGSRILIQRHGDEWNHWVTDANGTLLEKDADGFYRQADPVTVKARMTMRRQISRLLRKRVTEARRRVQTRSSAYSLTHGERHIPVILAAFKDQAFTVNNPASMFNALLNTREYSYNGATGSVRDFYYENSGGQFTPIFDVYGPVTLTKNMSSYGGNTDPDQPGSDKAPELALYEACKALDLQIDFSQYDYNNDGYVDMVLFYYAGENEAEYGPDDSIWPHSWNMTGSDNTTIQNGNNFDGKILDNYFCTSELSVDEVTDYSYTTKFCGIGTTCHEFGHSLGLPDFYDTDYGDSGWEIGDNHGCAADLYSYSTMCSGPYNNGGNTPPYFGIEERMMLGWVDASAIREFSTKGSVTIQTVNNNIAYKTPTSTSGEYFLYECRALSGWDAYLPGGPGLIVYHIDKSETLVPIWIPNYAAGYYEEVEVSAAELWSNWEATNQINENAMHPCGYLVPARDQDKIQYECYTGSYAGYTKPYDETNIPFPGESEGAVRTYTPKDWSGVESSIWFSDITYNSSAKTVTLTVNIPSESLDYNTIANPGNGVYSAGSAFALQLVESDTRVPQSVAWYLDDEPVSGGSVILPAGQHTIDAHITLTSGVTKIVTLDIIAS
ncbi:MAG: M6 family metalloprotease domain-containing protein [Bacteroidales bacterium]|nr:M6 family metalloprotease domain-containing protein [Bacteroidales bacterium]